MGHTTTALLGIGGTRGWMCSITKRRGNFKRDLFVIKVSNTNVKKMLYHSV